MNRITKINTVFVTAMCVLSQTSHSSTKSHDIFHSIDKGHEAHLYTYLDDQGDPNQVDSKGRSLLARAAYRGNLAMVKKLIASGALVDHEDDQQNTALYMASSAGFDDIVRLLISKSKNINQADARGVAALHIASKKGHVGVVTLLCAHSTLAINLKTHDGKTALWYASCEGQLSTVNCLLKAGAQVDLPDPHGITPLLISCYEGHNDVVDTLIIHNAHVSQSRDNGITPLIIASYQGHEHIVKRLISAGADPLYHAPDALGGGTALQYALQQDHQAISHYLHTLSTHKITEKKNEELARDHQIIMDMQAHIQKLTEQLTLSLQREQQARQEDLFHFKAKLDALTQHDQEKTEKLKQLEKDHDALLSEHNHKKQIEHQKEFLRSHPNLRIFYETVERTLNQLFLAYKVLDTGMVQRTGGKATMAASGVSFLGSIVPNSAQSMFGKGIKLLGENIPIPGVSLVASLISKGIRHAEDRVEHGHIRFIAKLVINTTILEEEVETAARCLSCMYEPQIVQLTENGAATLAECAVRRLIEFMRAEQIHDKLELAPQFIQAVAVFKSHQGSIPYTHKTIETYPPKDPTWTDKGIFQKTGIITEKGHLFAKSDRSEHVHYGFRKGTETDVDLLGYKNIS